MERTIRVLATDGTEIEAITVNHPALATRIFQAMSKDSRLGRLWLELEDDRHVVMASNYYEVEGK